MFFKGSTMEIPKCKCGKDNKFIDNIKGFSKYCSRDCLYKFREYKKSNKKICLYCSKKFIKSKSGKFCKADCKNNYEISTYGSIKNFILKSEHKKDKHFLKKYKLDGEFVYNVLVDSNKNCKIHGNKLIFISLRDGYSKCKICSSEKASEKRRKTNLEKKELKFIKAEEYLREYKGIVKSLEVSEKFNVSRSWIIKFLNKENMKEKIDEVQKTFINHRFFEKNTYYKTINGYLYSVKIKDLVTNEEFFKVGISLNPKRRFYDSTLKVDFLELKELNYYSAFILEQEIHKSYENYKFIPKRKIAGFTECYNKQIMLI